MNGQVRCVGFPGVKSGFDINNASLLGQDSGHVKRRPPSIDIFVSVGPSALSDGPFPLAGSLHRTYV